MNRRLLGIDLGERRIGLAICDEDGLEARPLATLPRKRDLAGDVTAIGRVVGEQQVVALVVGLPLEASGVVGPMAVAAREWGTALGGALGLPVRFRDERLSSHLAEQRLGGMGRGRTGGPPSRVQRERYRERVDREAAAIILQDELDSRAAHGTGDAGIDRSDARRS